MGSSCFTLVESLYLNSGFYPLIYKQRLFFIWRFMLYFPPRFLFRRFELLKKIESKPSFLEIGPGSFNLTPDLLKKHEYGVVIDYNAESKIFFKKLSPECKSQLTLIISDFLEYSFKATFDTIVACEVLEHVDDEKLFLQKVYNLLCEDGRLVLSVPAREKYWSIHDEGVGHLRRYEKHELNNSFRAIGFTKVEIVSYGFPFVNLFRFPRILLAKIKSRSNNNLTLEEQTKRSGLSQYKLKSSFIGQIMNKYTFFPLFIFSSFFNRFDFSNGYVVIAEK